MDPFDIRAPLPTGTTLLEASAGTGKTWTIGALVTRYVAEGVATLDELLVVTFGRAASQELRERVRAQLVEAERALADPSAPRPESRLLDLLTDCSPAETVLRRQRLRAALGSFDAATIATIHQFCQLVLRSLGVAGDTDSDATLVEDLDDLLTEVVDDLYLRDFAHRDGDPPFSRSAALALARAATGDAQARLEPADAADLAPGSGAAERVRFATAVRDELEVRKRRIGVLSYDDLLSQLAEALRAPDAPARKRMQDRWKVALVDEFQDTDPVQWQVFERAFSGVATMVLIGDPKQAIYAFRGGDVTTYLQAAATATTRQTLDTNFRSDADLVARLQRLMGHAALGDDEIVVHDVAAHHRGSRLAGAGPSFRLRVVRKADLGRSAGASLTVDRIRTHLFEDVARDIKRLLTSSARFEARAVRPRDVAVLAFKHADLQAIQAALAGHGVPAVVAGGGSVFHTGAAGEWLTLLEALEQPHRMPRVRAAALTSFVGRTARELDLGGDVLSDTLSDRMRDWSDLYAARGVAAVLEAAAAEGMTSRLLTRVDGERLVTDLRHIGQSLHRTALEERMGLVALAGWLRAQMADDKVEVASERTRRLDSDAAAVQLVTIHGSKGLQYPIVYLPTLWDRFVRDPEVPLFHAQDPGDAGRRCRNVGGGGPHWDEHVARHQLEDAGESLRLLYVALTRAQSQVVAWHAPAPKNAPASPLHRMIFGRLPGSASVPAQQALVDEDRVVEILAKWRDAGGPVPEPAVWADIPASPLPVAQDTLSVRTFTRSVDTEWRRTSYSSLTAAAAPIAGAVALSEPEDAPLTDEPDEPDDGPDGRPDQDAPAPGLPDGGSVVSPMAGLPAGATFGSLVHAVLEHADPDATDFRAELLGHIDEQRVWWPVNLDREELADALVEVCDSPLGPLAGDLTLRAIPLSDRLRELEFELPLSGGDDHSHPVGDVRLRDIAPLLDRHLPEADPVRRYSLALADPALGSQSLRGYLTGSIDVLLRVRSGDTDRYVTVDYKTNWLGGYDEPLTSADYRPAALAAAMEHSDYPLQALLYTVVQHRYLRWRLTDYDPERHLGGVLYLYLRGMCGPETPVVDGEPCGVFSWRAPVALVEALSDLLDGVSR